MSDPVGLEVDTYSYELAQFREQWKAEVKQRTTRARASSSSLEKIITTTPSGLSARLTTELQSSSVQGPTNQLAHAHHPAVSAHSFKGLSSAVENSRLAIQQQSGDLTDHEALRLYRNAFRLDSNVEKSYREEELCLETAAARSESSFIKHPHRASSLDADAAIPTKESSRAMIMSPKHSSAGTLAYLVSSFPSGLEFESLDEKGVPLRLLPDEILVLILKPLDPLSIERFAMLNRKARVLSLDSAIWRFLVQKTYIPPQIPGDLTTDTIAEHYMFDYRRFFVEHPRLRLDGVYIAVCQYVRPGINSDNAWVHVSHLITYHRYLRFFSNGSVLSLLANEDVEPRTIIPLLKPSLRMKGLFIGNWCLEGTTILVRDLADPSGGNTRYTFQMTLTLQSRPMGRWNKLDFAGYDSVNTENGEAIPLALKHERPFWFSKVRSYTI